MAAKDKDTLSTHKLISDCEMPASYVALALCCDSAPMSLRFVEHLLWLSFETNWHRQTVNLNFFESDTQNMATMKR